jgi:AraC-like DNA-binding protein
MSSDLTALVETRVRWAMHHYELPPSHDWRNTIPACALWLMLDGSARVATQNRSFEVVKGNAFLSDCRLQREITIPHRAEWLTVGLEAPLLSHDLLLDIGPPVKWNPSEEQRARLQFYMSELVNCFPACGTATLMVEGLARVLVGLILQEYGIHNFGDSRGGAPFWLAAVLRCVREKPGVSVADLAREAHFSLAQFRRVFHEWAGMSPHEFLQRERLDRARRMLENTGLSIEAIARQTGFSGASPFTRAFRQFTGMTPASYRKGTRESAKNQA